MAATYRFDENQLKDRLVPLDSRRRAAFAAACAERLFPMYARYHSLTGFGDLHGMRALLDQLWAGIIDDRPLQPDLEELLRQSEELGPSVNYESATEDERADIDAPSVAIAFALESLVPENVVGPVHAARQAFDVLWTYTDSDERRWSVPATAQQLEEHMATPLIQRELERQLADLDELSIAQSNPAIGEAIMKVRLRAARDAASFFGD